MQLAVVARASGNMITYIGALALGIAAIAVVAIPLGSVVWEYWKPHVTQKAAAVEVAPQRKGR